MISCCSPPAAAQRTMLPMATTTSPKSAQLTPPLPKRSAAHSRSGRKVQSMSGSQLLAMEAANRTTAPSAAKQATNSIASTQRPNGGRRHDRHALAAARIGGTKTMTNDCAEAYRRDTYLTRAAPRTACDVFVRNRATTVGHGHPVDAKVRTCAGNTATRTGNQSFAGRSSSAASTIALGGQNTEWTDA